MCEEGLFKRFDCDRIFAVHNRPICSLGNGARASGPSWRRQTASPSRSPVVAATRRGRTCSCDPMVVAANLILAAQTIVSRNVSPLETAVMGISAVEGGNLPASNVVPDKVIPDWHGADLRQSRAGSDRSTPWRNGCWRLRGASRAG